MIRFGVGGKFARMLHAPSRPVMPMIHVLEDDPAVRDSLMLLLRNMGHEVACYSDGESFLRTARPAPDDNVIVDLKLPGISGADVITWLQQLDQPPRIIAMSGQPATAIRKQLRGINVAHVLRKPLNADEVAACLTPVSG